MTRKHFNAMAKHIRYHIEHIDMYAGVAMARCMADFCAEQNPNFNRAMFLEACGV